MKTVVPSAAAAADHQHFHRGDPAGTVQIPLPLVNVATVYAVTAGVTVVGVIVSVDNSSKLAVTVMLDVTLLSVRGLAVELSLHLRKSIAAVRHGGH